MTKPLTYEQKRIKLTGLLHKMKQIAIPHGSMHSWWDSIFDIDAFIKGEPTILDKTADEWIVYALRLLEGNKRPCQSP